MSTPFIVRHKIEKALTGRDTSTIDIRPHFLPLDIEALAVSLQHKLVKMEDAQGNKTTQATLNQLYNHIVDFVQLGKLPSQANQLGGFSSSFPFTLTSGPGGYLIDVASKTSINNVNVKEFTPAKVISASGQLVGVLTTDTGWVTGAYGVLGKLIFEKFLNMNYSTKYLKGGYTGKYKKGFDIGHIKLGSLGETPSMLQADNVMSNIDEAISTQTDAVKIAVLNKVKANVAKARETLLIHTTYGAQLSKLSFYKEFSEGLLKVSANIVIAQDREENSVSYGQREKAMIEEVTEELKNIHFSNNIKEELVQQLLAKITGKKISSTKKRVDVPVIKTNKPKSIRPTVGSISLARGPLRSSDTGKFIKTSASSLLAIINYHLHDVVAANMGDGDSRSVLNYRTGRLATSTKAVSLSVSRDGMITVFYNYMKNPYATFSEGGRQQYPRTRDPKLLISKSIRDIAAPLVSNRLRSVVV